MQLGSRSVVALAGFFRAQPPRPDDETLRRRIAEEFGTSGGFGITRLRVNYWGGINPRIDIQIGADTPVELSGRDLLAAVREALNLTRPGALF